jgi:hypothetical protein
MAKEQRSPQQKKQFELSKDHFTFGRHSSRMFPKTWKRKKIHANREFRRKSDLLLAQTKPEMPADDVELIVGDITPAQLTKSVIRKRLHKAGTVTVGEKVKLKLEKRAETIGRRVKSHEKYDRLAAEAVSTLTALDGKQLIDFVRRAATFLHGGDPIEWARIRQSHDRIERALSFLENLQRGSAHEREALCRSDELGNAFRDWATKANRILGKDRKTIQKKIQQKEATEKMVKTLRRQAQSTRMTRSSA